MSSQWVLAGLGFVMFAVGAGVMAGRLLFAP
jgi:hypothetical protein